MAEVTGQQIDALTSALGKLESRLNSGGGGGGNTPTNQDGPDVSKLGGAIKSAGTNFIGAMATGTQSLSGVAKEAGKIMNVLPGLGGALSSLTVETVKYLERSQASFNALAKSGAGFEGNLGELNRAAAATRLPLDQFTKLVGSNAQNLTALGGGVNEGARRFAELSNAMFQEGAIDGFMALGMTLEESNEFLMDSIALQRRSGVFQKMTDAERVRSAAELAKSFDSLAKLTGKQAKEMQNEVMERQNAGATQARLRLLEKQGVKGATDAYNAAQKGLAGGPAVMRNLMDDLVQTGVPMSKATQAFAATNKEAFALMKQAAEATKRGDTAEAARLSEQAAAKGLEYANSEQGLRLATLSQVSDIAKGQADALEEVGNTIDALNENAKKMAASTGTLATTSESYANLLKKMTAQTENQVALQDKGQQALKFVNEAQQEIANSSKVVRDGLAGTIETNDTFTKALRDAANTLNTELSAEKLNHLGEFFNKLGDYQTAAEEAENTTGNANATSKEVSEARRNDGNADITAETSKGIIDKIVDFFSFKATGGSISPSGSYIVGERGPEIVTDSVGSVMNAAQSANAFGSAAQNSGQDVAKLINAMETANEQLSTLIAINTRQAVLGDKQVRAIKGAGNLIKGI